MDTYYEADAGVICAACHARITAAPQSDGGRGRFARALGFGIIAAIAGATTYFALLAATGREMTLVLLFVGFVVGRAVRVGSRGRGGRRFQWLAVVLTYLAIVATYVPFVVKGFSGQSTVTTTQALPAPTLDGSFLAVAAAPAPIAEPAPSLGASAVGLGALLLLAFAAPVLEGVNNGVGMLITVAALLQAWRMNRRTDVVITGPYHVRASNS